jgi:uncharacterized protein (DUF924 family)
MLNPQDVIHFWFDELTPQDQFRKSESLDLKIKTKFETTLQKALAGELFSWRKNPEGRLAEIILLDQFSRNIYRDQPKAFAADNVALVLSQEAVALGIDQQLDTRKRVFLYMPYMHSESKLIHETAVKLFNQVGMENNLEYELKHKSIIDKFGRFPHRNKILNRPSTPEEIEFLKQPNSSF